MPKLLGSLLGLLMLNAGVFTSITLAWTLLGSHTFIGEVLLSPEYRIDSAVMEASVTDISTTIIRALWLSCAVTITTGLAWVVVIWWAHLDSPGYIARLRWRWITVCSGGFLLTASLLAYVLFAEIAILRRPADTVLWLIFMGIYLSIFYIASLVTTPYIARPAVPLGAALLPR